MIFRIKSNKIYIKNYTPRFLNYLNENLKAYNEMHKKAKFMNIPQYKIPEYLYFYNINKKEDEIVLNIALLHKIEHFFNKEDIETQLKLNYKQKHRNIQENIALLSEENSKKGIKLYPYQEQALKTILNAYSNNKKVGILEARPGSGKTEIFLKLIHDLKLKTLVIAHTVDLIKQTKERLDNYYNYNTYILNNKDMQYKTKDADVVFATIQTLINSKDFVKNSFDLVIIDECHHYPSNGKKNAENKYIKKIYDLNFKFLLGVTATNFRADFKIEDESIPLLASLGETFYRIEKEDTAKNTIQKVDIKTIQTNFSIYNIKEKYKEVDGTASWSGVINSIAEDKNRNDIIIIETINQIKQKRKVIILCDRVKHVEILYNLFNKYTKKIAIFEGKTRKKERDLIIEKAKDGEIDIILTNYKIFTEGIDLPNFDTLLFATPRKFKGTMQQSIGRIQRIDKNNKDKKPLLIDIVDTEIKFLRKMAIERNKFYKQEKY